MSPEPCNFNACLPNSDCQHVFARGLSLAARAHLDCARSEVPGNEQSQESLQGMTDGSWSINATALPPLAGVTLRLTFSTLLRVPQQHHAPITCMATGSILTSVGSFPVPLTPLPTRRGHGVMSQIHYL